MSENTNYITQQNNLYNRIDDLEIKIKQLEETLTIYKELVEKLTKENNEIDCGTF